MDYRVLGSTGVRVSALGYGAAPAGYLGVEQTAFEQLLRSLHAEGVNTIDTAECYPGAEAMIGRALRGSRDRWAIITKCGHAVEGDREPDWSPALLRASIDRSLKRMHTDRVEVMLLHSCSLELLRAGDVLEPLRDAKRAGKALAIGYSGDNEAAAYAARLPEIDVLEVSINICDQYNIEHVLPIARERKLGVIAKRPIANAAWKPLSSQQGIYSDYARKYSDRFGAMGLDTAKMGFHGEANDAWPEIAIRFAAHVQGVHTAVAGSTNIANLRQLIEAVNRGPLEHAAVAYLSARFQQAQMAAGETWQGQT